LGPGRAVGDPGRTRHRLSAAGAGACRLRVRPRRTERTERGSGTRERLARRRFWAGVPDRLGPAGREPDVLFVPRGILMKGQARGGVWWGGAPTGLVLIPAASRGVGQPQA